MSMTAEIDRHPEAIKDYVRERIQSQLSALGPDAHLIRHRKWISVEELRETLAPLIDRNTIEIDALEDVSCELASILRHLGEWSRFHNSIPSKIAEIVKIATPELEVIR